MMKNKFVFEVAIDANVDAMWTPYLEGALRNALKEFTGTCAHPAPPSLISALNRAEVRYVEVRYVELKVNT